MERKCTCGSGEYRTPVNDGYGIFLFYACSKCHKAKIGHYRRDIMERYLCDEPIEEQ